MLRTSASGGPTSQACVQRKPFLGSRLHTIVSLKAQWPDLWTILISMTKPSVFTEERMLAGQMKTGREGEEGVKMAKPWKKWGETSVSQSTVLAVSQTLFCEVEVAGNRWPRRTQGNVSVTYPHQSMSVFLRIEQSLHSRQDIKFGDRAMKICKVGEEDKLNQQSWFPPLLIPLGHRSWL